MTVVAADPITEMGEFSVFGKVDLAELAQRRSQNSHRPADEHATLLVDSKLFHRSEATRSGPCRNEALRPDSASRTKSFPAHRPAGCAFGSELFANSTAHRKTRPCKTLVAATEGMSPDLQVSRAEAQKYSAGQPVFAFWTELLAKRAQDFAAGGASRQVPYDHAKNPVQPGQELNGLMKQQPKISRQFGGFLDATGLLGGKGSLGADNYWQLLEVEDVGVLTLGASYTRATSGGGAQLADGFYYASGGYNVALTLYQLWPVNVGRACFHTRLARRFHFRKYSRDLTWDRTPRLRRGNA